MFVEGLRIEIRKYINYIFVIIFERHVTRSHRMCNNFCSSFCTLFRFTITLHFCSDCNSTNIQWQSMWRRQTFKKHNLNRKQDSEATSTNTKIKNWMCNYSDAARIEIKYIMRLWIYEFVSIQKAAKQRDVCVMCSTILLSLTTQFGCSISLSPSVNESTYVLFAELHLCSCCSEKKHSHNLRIRSA